MAITLADFTKIWASTSPLTPYSFSDPNYQEGWNFIGSTPPARQMWDSIQKQNDEKLKYIVDNFLPLSGGTMTGAIVGNPLTLTADDGNGNTASLIANPNGTITWNEEEVVRVDSVNTNTKYIRFSNGLQFYWGLVSSVTTTDKTFTFDPAFISPPTIAISSAYAQLFSINSVNAGDFKYHGNGSGFSFIAIGFWK